MSIRRRGIRIAVGWAVEGVLMCRISLSGLSTVVRLLANGRAEFEQAILQVCLPFLQPDPTRTEPVYGKAGDLVFYVEVSQAKMIQLLSGVVEEHQLADAVPQEPTCLPLRRRPVLGRRLR